MRTGAASPNARGGVGVAAATDSVEASLKAYLSAVGAARRAQAAAA